MMSLIRCYDYNLRYALIISEIEENRDMKRHLEETKGSKNFKKHPSYQYGDCMLTNLEFDFSPIPDAKEKIKQPYFMARISQKFRDLERWIELTSTKDREAFFLTEQKRNSDST